VSNIDDHVAQSVKAWIWSGFYSRLEVREMAHELVEDESQVDATDFFINAEWSAKKKAERRWPSETDCDRLDKVWEALRSQGIISVQNAGYTTSDGHQEVDVAVAREAPGLFHGYVFYHGQDLERAVHSGDLYLAFGSLDGNEQKDVVVGNAVREALEKAGFKADWNGNRDKRILIRGLEWRKRGPA
jgi:hypothetical protein